MLPFDPPPPSDSDSNLPSLPSPPRSQWSESYGSSYTLSTHIIPAAYLRSCPDAQLPQPPPEDSTLSKAQRAGIIDTGVARLHELRKIRDSEDKASGKEEGYPKRLWICLNRYARNESAGSKKGLTLFFAHANGFNKEIWEPVIEHLLSNPAGQAVEEIWAWDAVQHGDSALLNAGNLDALFLWSDAARDLLNFLVNFLPTSTSNAPLPLHLPQVPPQESERRKRDGFGADRTLVAIGHSFGGCTCAIASFLHPALFSSLMLVDPVILRPLHPTQPRDVESMRKVRPMSVDLPRGALGRRGAWPSRGDAHSKFILSPMFAAWHPAALNSYVQHALYQDPLGKVRLKMTPVQEALLFAETLGGAEMAWKGIAEGRLDERIELRWVVPGEGKQELGSPGETRARVWLRPKNSSHTRIPGAGHLIPQEAPKALALDMCGFIERKYLGTTNVPKASL